MIIDGKALAEKRIDELRVERKKFGPLKLGIVVMYEDAVTASYLKIKRRAAEALDVTTEYYANLNAVPDVDGIILQLPLPQGVDTDRERNLIPPEKDVDILSDAAYQRFVEGRYPPPPVPRAFDYVMQSNNVSYEGKQVVVVGRGKLVGKPAAEMFRQRGAHVTVLGRDSDVASYTKDADIVVLGTGVPHLLKPHMLKPGVVILDGGTSESSGKVVGDADPACVEIASVFTPVPRGVGPLAVVEIFANLFILKALPHGH